jgi:PHD/YefM family antitoxin component YafN of YafNO toxin-antitoxin module
VNTLDISTNITRARKNLFELADRVLENSEIVNISTKKGNLVLISADDYSAIRETLYLANHKQTREDIIEGLKTPVAECVEVDLNCYR